jgi:2'-5' RNA ligase
LTDPLNEYSLWLLPSATQQHELTTLVNRLAARFGTQPFIPHLTIQGDLTMSLDAVSRAAQTIAKQHSPQRWRITTVEGSEHFFRSLYLRFDETPAYIGSKAAMQSANGGADGLSLFPHVSVAYGVADEVQKFAVINELSSMIGNEITFDRVVVARSSKHVRIADWACLVEFNYGAV